MSGPKDSGWSERSPGVWLRTIGTFDLYVRCLPKSNRTPTWHDWQIEGGCRLMRESGRLPELDVDALKYACESAARDAGIAVPIDEAEIERLAEESYWRFDANRSTRDGMTERDAFKSQIRIALRGEWRR